MLTPLLPLPDANVTGVCCCRPRVTFRPPESLVEVSQMLTVSPAAFAAPACTSPPAATMPTAAVNTTARSRRRCPHRVSEVVIVAGVLSAEGRSESVRVVWIKYVDQVLSYDIV